MEHVACEGRGRVQCCCQLWPCRADLQARVGKRHRAFYQSCGRKTRDGSRIKRLRRACVEQVNIVGKGSEITVAQKPHWRTFVQDKIVKYIRRTPACQRTALAALDKATTELDERNTASRIIDWKRTINRWGLPALRAGSRNIKPAIAPLAFSADKMKANWETV